MRRRILLVTGLLGGALLTSTAAAQVGHDPAGSPYRTLRYSQFIGLNGGLFRGGGGSIDVAPHHGQTLGLRFDLFSAGTLTLGIQASYLALERMVVDPRKPIATALSGPVSQGVGMLEGLVQFNLTGSKTWNRIAPYVAGGLGIVRAGSTSEDSSGYSFGTRFAFTPGAGARVFLADRLFLRLEARATFWSVTYPPSFRTRPSSDPTQPAVLASPSKEWLVNPWFTAGLSYAFSRPF
jgi:opacity protein-like surface antigen